jgi:hypothetical protein
VDFAAPVDCYQEESMAFAAHVDRYQEESVAFPALVDRYEESVAFAKGRCISSAIG